MNVEACADRLQESHPDDAPHETPWPLMCEWLSEVGVDSSDDVAVAAVLAAWDLRCR